MSLSYPNNYQYLENLFFVEPNFSKSLFVRTMRKAMFYCREYDAELMDPFKNYLVSVIQIIFHWTFLVDVIFLTFFC